MRGTHVMVVGLLLVALLASAGGCAGQTSEKPGKGAPAAGKAAPVAGKPAPAAGKEAPAAGKAAPGQAKTEAPGASSKGSDEEAAPEASPWHDTVHWFGLIGTLLAFVVFLGGAVIYVGFNVRGKPFTDPTRKVIRAIHMTGGVVAITLGTVHYVGRCVQAGQAFLNPIPPVYAQAGFLLLLVSGILRFWTPKPIRKQWYIFAYLHRLGFIVALYHVTRHAQYQMSKFTSKH
jgi:hypothetical protein